MAGHQFAEFASVIQSMSQVELDREIQEPKRLLLDTGSSGAKRIDVAYAPFDFVNLKARIVIVGLTPGRQQMRNALHEAKRLLDSGASIEAAAEGAKVFASFSGTMRNNLVALLDHVGLSQRLGVASTQALWNGRSDLVHFTSALRYPVFVDGDNYSGAPDMLKTPLLARHLKAWFASEMAALPDAWYVPLGPKVAAALASVARDIGINPGRVLSGMPHPSGANAERISFFLGRKPRSALSAKTNPDSLVAAKAVLIQQINNIGAGTA